jgi:hypothetical protein
MFVSSTVDVDASTGSRQPLTLQERCDSCGAQAFVAVTFPTGSELLFCGHHYRKHEAALASQGVSVHDERDRINDKPSVSANAV